MKSNDQIRIIPFNRLLVLGCSGAGKSTLSERLSQITGLPLVCLDRLYWKPGWEHLSREEFRVVLDESLSANQWIMDGDFDHTLAHRLDYCDAAVLLDYPTIVCLAGVIRRWVTHYGKTRSSMTEGCPERLDGDFIRWVISYRRTRRPDHMKLLKQAGEKDNHPRIFILKNRRQCRKWLASITALYEER